MASRKFPSFTNTWHDAPYDDISLSRPELAVQGRTVVVTGGGTGIGKAIAKAFAQAGASSVAIIGRREDRLKTAIQEITKAVGSPDSKLLYEVADLTKREATEQAFAKIVEAQGGCPIDICVSNAGATPTPRLVADSDEEEWMHLVYQNVRSTLNMAHAFIPRAAKDATLLHVSTGLVHMLPRMRVSAHAASKAASAKLVEYIQAENPDLHVVSIQPGSVTTEATQNVNVVLPDDRKSPSSDQAVKRDVADNAIADLPGHFCVWLASEEAKFLKGKFVWANWDVKELISRADEIRNSRLLTIMLEGMDM